MVENTELEILENLKKGMVDNTEGEVLENLKKGMVGNTEGEVLENLKKVNGSLCRVVHMLQGPNSGETSDATKLNQFHQHRCLARLVQTQAELSSLTH